MQHFKFVNLWFRFLMLQTGHIRPVLTITAEPQRVGSLHSPLNLQQVYPVRRSTADCRAQYKSRAQKNCKHKK